MCVCVCVCVCGSTLVISMLPYSTDTNKICADTGSYSFYIYMVIILCNCLF